MDKCPQARGTAVPLSDVISVDNASCLCPFSHEGIPFTHPFVHGLARHLPGTYRAPDRVQLLRRSGRTARASHSGAAARGAGGRQRASAPLTRYVHLRLIEASIPTATAFQEDFHPRRLNFCLVVQPRFGISSLVKYKPTVSTKPGVALPLPTCSWTRPDTGP